MTIATLFIAACIGVLIWAGIVFLGGIDWTYIKLVIRWITGK